MQKRIGRDGKAYYSIQFYLPSGKRTTIRLGAISAKAAKSIDSHVEHLVASKRHGTRVDEETKAWLKTADKSLVKKLNEYGLCRLYENPTVEQFVASFVERKEATVKSGTHFLITQVQNQLKEFFKGEKLLSDVDESDAEDLWIWLLKTKGLGENTARRQFGRIREIFNAAVRQRLLSHNPFKLDNRPVSVGAGRKEYIPEATIKLVIEHCTSTEWKLLFAFGRFVGCRMPSEIRELKWEDVNRERNTILLKSPKTERNGRAERLVPIFPEIDSLLSKRWAEADEGEVYVFPSLRHHTNLATTAAKYVKAAGFVVWPKFWNSLRASRETDLMDSVGLRRACAWIGNSPTVAMKHYALVKKTDYVDGGQSDAESDATQAPMASFGITTPTENAGFLGILQEIATPHGFEP